MGFLKKIGKVVRGGRFNAGKGGKSVKFGRVLEKVGAEIIDISSYAGPYGVPVMVAGLGVSALGTAVARDKPSEAIRRPIKSKLESFGLSSELAHKWSEKIANGILPDPAIIKNRNKKDKTDKKPDKKPDTGGVPVIPNIPEDKVIEQLLRDSLKELRIHTKENENQLKDLIKTTHRALVEEKLQSKDLNNMNKTMNAMKREIKHQSNQNEMLRSDLVEGLEHLDQEEELIRKELETIEQVQRQELEEQDNIEERLIESQLDFNDVSDFYQVIKTLDNFDEVLDLLIRQQDDFEKLSEQEQFSLIEFLSVSF